MPAHQYNIDHIKTNEQNIYKNNFHLTCLSFSSICNNLSTITNTTFSSITFDVFGKNCDIIHNYLRAAILKATLTPLFILSFRREFFLNDYYYSINQHCSALILNFFVSVDKEKFHNVNQSILLHTHISKAGGTANFKAIQMMAQELTKYKYIDYKYEILNCLVPGSIFQSTDIFVESNHFDGGSLGSCSELYDDAVLYGKQKENGKIIRMANERPLSVWKLCPEFYNSVIIREPINHRLSFLAFENAAFSDAVSIWKGNKMVTKSEEMKGLINELFVVNNTGYKIDKLRRKTRKLNEQHTHLLEWINPNTKNFVLRTKLQHKNDTFKFKFPYLRFNTSHLMGWLSNTYARWIGYDHRNKNTLFDSISIDYIKMNQNWQYLNTNTKRILIQYDYVLPLDLNTYTTDSSVWIYYAKDVARKIFNVMNDSYSPINALSYRGDMREYLRRSSFDITTKRLFNAFNESGEIDLLRKVNQIDLKIFDFSKQIASVDVLFRELSKKNKKD